MMPVESKPFLTIEETDVWFEDLQAGDVEYGQYWRLLSEQEQYAAQRFIHELHRLRYVVCHGKVRLLLSRYLDIDPKSIRMGRHEMDKPYLLNAHQGSLALRFNLSHSGDRMLLAVGSRELGVDIEVWSHLHNPESLVCDILAPEELAYWRQLPSDGRISAFYRFWTRKESLVKAVGTGIGIGLNRIVANTNGRPGFKDLPSACGHASDWRLIDLKLGTEISGALTVKVEAASSRRHMGFECGSMPVGYCALRS